MTLAQDVGVQSVRSFTAELLIRPWMDGTEITGQLRATTTRICGVTLELFDEEVEEVLSLRMVPTGSKNAPRGVEAELVLAPDADDPPDEVSGETIDLAACLTEQLALALSPFSRKPGAVFEPLTPRVDPSPFAVLERLKRWKS